MNLSEITALNVITLFKLIIVGMISLTIISVLLEAAWHYLRRIFGFTTETFSEYLERKNEEWLHTPTVRGPIGRVSESIAAKLVGMTPEELAAKMMRDKEWWAAHSIK